MTARPKEENVSVEATDLGVSPGRLTMHFEVELGIEVRPGR